MMQDEFSEKLRDYQRILDNDSDAFQNRIIRLICVNLILLTFAMALTVIILRVNRVENMSPQQQQMQPEKPTENLLCTSTFGVVPVRVKHFHV